MFNILQHLFTARALQRENDELVAKVANLQAQIDEYQKVVAIKDEEIWSLKNNQKPTIKISQEALDRASIPDKNRFHV